MKDFCSRKTFFKVADFVKGKSLIKKGDKVIAAVSGGADSVFMLFCLLGLKTELSFDLSLCHFNHNLRKEAEEEEAFVRGLAEKFSLPFFCEKGNVKQYAKEKNLSIEMAARELRHSFFKKLIAAGKGNLIALAHNLTDSIETFFLNIERGTGIRGLKGISPQNNFLIRPVLCLSKNEIRESLDSLKIEYRVDKSNFDEKIKRNAVRGMLIKGLYDVFGYNVENRFNSLFENIDNTLKSHSFFMENYLKGKGVQDNFGVRVKLNYLKDLPDYAFYELMLFLLENISGSTYGVTKNLLRNIFEYARLFKSFKRSLFPDKSLYIAKTKKHLYLIKKEFFGNFDFSVKSAGEYSLPLGYRFVFERIDKFEISKKNSYAVFNRSLLDLSISIGRVDFEKDYLIYNGKKVFDLNKFLKKRGLSKFERETVFVLKKSNEILYIPDIAISDTLKKPIENHNLIKVYIEDSLV